MAALIIAALFWGNCFSCPQLLLAAQKHGCCPHTKSSKTECQTPGLKSFVRSPKNRFLQSSIATAVIEAPAQASEFDIPLLAPRITDHGHTDNLPLRI